MPTLEYRMRFNSLAIVCANIYINTQYMEILLTTTQCIELKQRCIKYK